jgi:hypothetical protein
MFPPFPFLSKGGRCTVNRIGSKQHLAHLAHRIARGVADAVDVLGPAEFGK